ncbi:hypothetical protein GCM10011491_11670 [Brucella endophytica]|uniref:Uncharacterized protein n=1 Tax=Brucella endophytica TaxID=1963359 RepID=A0A916S5P0_9HYPH|nr:hypothetical protein GCM10011491_11670 [Brucella endophytica]
MIHGHGDLLRLLDEDCRTFSGKNVSARADMTLEQTANVISRNNRSHDLINDGISLEGFELDQIESFGQPTGVCENKACFGRKYNVILEYCGVRIITLKELLPAFLMAQKAGDRFGGKSVIAGQGSKVAGGEFPRVNRGNPFEAQFYAVERSGNRVQAIRGPV